MDNDKNVDMTETASMDQVRQLLFGSQMKEMDSRVSRQEERINRAIEETRSGFKDRIDVLENFMKSEVIGLLSRIKDEQSEREDRLKVEQKERMTDLATMSNDLSAAMDATDKKITKLAHTLDNFERELRQLYLSGHNTLTEKIQESYEDSISVISETAAQIRADMVHRNVLANLFTETAIKLSGNWNKIDEEFDTSDDE